MVKLTDIVDALSQDDEMKKLAAGAGLTPAGGASAGAETTTQTPDSEMVGETIEDEKAKIQTKLMELAGTENEAISAGKGEETLNASQQAPAGEKLKPVEEAAAAVAPQAKQAAEVIGEALQGMEPAIRKQACLEIISKISQMNALSLEDLSGKEGEKVAKAKFEEYDTAGRIMARGYHDECQKIATEIEAEDGKTEPAVEQASDGELTAEEIKILEAIEG